METKICTMCHQEKPLDEFPKQGVTATGKQRYRGNCKVCHNNNMKERYHTAKQFTETFKDQCVKCGETRAYVLDFHHRDASQKDFTIGKMKRTAEETLRKEIEKCVCLCANCHREFHYLERETQITIQDYLDEKSSL